MADITQINEVAEVLAAFDAAQQAGCPIADCYNAAVAAWSQYHPEHVREYTSQQAVNIVLRGREKVLLGIE